MMITNPLAVGIGLRYTRARRRNHFISFITFASVVGVMLGVATLIIVLSVMNGFQSEVRERLLSVTSHATVEAPGGLENWQSIEPVLEQSPEVLGAAPYVHGQGMLSANGQVKGGFLRGISPQLEPNVSQLADVMKEGKLTDLEAGKYRVLLGTELATSLGVRLGDKVTLVVPQARVTVAGIKPRMRRFVVAGIFETKTSQYDRSLALMHLQDAQTLLRMKGKVSGVRLKLTDPLQAPEVANRLQYEMSGIIYVNDWTKEHANYFHAVQIEKRMMRLMLSLIVLVAVFNIVSTLVMVVADKESEIAVLRTMGFSPGSIMGVFITQGMVIGVFGTILGVISGVWVALNLEGIVSTIEGWTGAKVLPGNVYYISYLPSDLHWSDVGTIGVLSLVLTLLATLYPARRASKIQPAESLRYE